MSKLVNEALDPMNLNVMNANVVLGNLGRYGGFFDLIWGEIFPVKTNISLVRREDLHNRLMSWMHGHASDVAQMLEKGEWEDARMIASALNDMMDAFDKLTELPAGITHILFEDGG